MKTLRVILAALLLAAPVQAQQLPQAASGFVLGNDTAATRNARPSSVSALLDRALGSTRGAMIERGASGWALIGPGTAGKPLIMGGAGADPTTTATLGIVGGGTNCAAASGTCLDNITGFASTGLISRTGAGTYSFTTAAALTKTDDTNVTVTLGGTPSTALLQAVSMTFGWAGTLAVSRGGTGGGTASGTLLDNITAFSGTGYIRRTGAGAYAFSAAATGAQYLAGTATNVPIEPSVIYQAEVDNGNSGTGTATFDFSLFINVRVTMTGNITTQTLSNVTAGKAGTITFIQDATGGRTTVWNTIFKFAGGTTPTLSTAASAVDILSYSCRSATFCAASLMKDVK